MAGDRPARFSYRGRSVRADPGETVLGAIARRGVPVVARSNRYRRPRGPFCGVGQCTGCLVRVNGVPGTRACRHVPLEGDRVEDERGWPSARFDLLGAIDLLFPGGFDSLRGLRRPAFLTPVYQWGVRRLLGVGALPEAAPPARPPVTVIAPKVVVVGGGRSGRAVAQALRTEGLRPLVLERALGPLALEGADGRPATSATFLPRPAGGRFTMLGFTEPDRGVALRTRAVVIATGSYDAGLLFGGNDRPGVLTAEGALSLVGPGRRPPFRRAVVVGGGGRVRGVLDRCGDAVAAVVAPSEIRPEVVRRASELDVPLYPRSLVLRAAGRSGVRRLYLRTRGRGPTFSLACDAVVLAHRRLPHTQLFFQAGARLDWSDARGAYFPVVDDAGATTVPGLYAIGSVAGDAAPGVRPEDLAHALAARRPVGPPRTAASGPVAEIVGYYRELLGERRRGRWMACPCEDVLLREIEEAVAAGYRGVEVTKRYTGLGTGLCQGRYCVPDALLVLSLLEGRPPPAVGYITQRPPVHPMPLASLAELDGALPSEAEA